MILDILLSRKRTLWIEGVYRSSCRSSNSILHEFRSLLHPTMRTPHCGYLFSWSLIGLARENAGGSDYKRGHGSGGREDLSARKRDRKWKEEWTGLRTGESKPRTRGAKGREKGEKGKFRLRGMGSGARSRSRWKPRQNRQTRTSHQR